MRPHMYVYCSVFEIMEETNEPEGINRRKRSVTVLEAEKKMRAVGTCGTPGITNIQAGHTCRLRRRAVATKIATC